jgi:hypothetical protein
MRADRDAAYDRFINAWGTEQQVLKAIEECSELIQVLAREVMSNRDKKGLTSYYHAPTFEEMVDEVADAYLMLDQLAYMFGRDNIEQVMERKLTRVLQLVERHEVKNK